MSARRWMFLAAAALAACVGCVGRSEPTIKLRGLAGSASQAEAGGEFQAGLELSSPVVARDGSLPAAFTCDGRNASPPLSWTGVPSGTRSLALLVDSPDEKLGTFNHWVVFNLPPDLEALPEGIAPGAALGSVGGPGEVEPVQGTNDFRNVGYDGPCPPEGQAHRYVIHLYALDEVLSLDASATRAQVLDAIKGRVLGEARLTTTYARDRAG